MTFDLDLDLDLGLTIFKCEMSCIRDPIDQRSERSDKTS